MKETTCSMKWISGGLQLESIESFRKTEKGSFNNRDQENVLWCRDNHLNMNKGVWWQTSSHHHGKVCGSRDQPRPPVKEGPGQALLLSRLRPFIVCESSTSLCMVVCGYTVCMGCYES